MDRAADADGPNWTDARIAEAYHCRVQTIENLRKRLVSEGFETALNGLQRESPPTPRLLDGQGEARLIPHAELMKSVARRVSDGAMLRLVKLWLVASVEETDACGHVQRTTRNKDTGRGTPQGAPLLPLLANLYMRRFVVGWKQLGHERNLKSRIVNYADDFVICCRRGYGAKARETMRQMMERLKLTVNESKTHLCRLPDETFNFLGYTFGRFWSRRTGKAYLGHRPAAKSCQRLRDRIHEETGRRWLLQSEAEMVAKLNQILVGWRNYFSVGTIGHAYHAVDAYVFQRLRQWWCRKHNSRNRRDSRFSTTFLYEQLGLARLRAAAPRSVSEGVMFDPRAGCGKTACPVR